MLARIIGAMIVFATTGSAAVGPGDGGTGLRSQPTQVRTGRVPRTVLAFYYPWYGNPSAEGGSGRWFHWESADEASRQIANRTDYPKLGAYDSHDPEVIARHCTWAKQAGIDGFIVSWWGAGTFEDLALPRILDACAEAGLAATIYYETVPGVPKTARSAESDLQRVLERHAAHPAWLKVDRMPVVFVFGCAESRSGARSRLLTFLGKRTFQQLLQPYQFANELVIVPVNPVEMVVQGDKAAVVANCWHRTPALLNL
ncbi:MAG: glycoside hydrolase family 71/99 protein [Planctomycetota bacterium]|jgi:hypothetical protein